ncbi:hypothetical protein RU639_004044 [Aspergillus parasiticus]
MPLWFNPCNYEILRRQIVIELDTAHVEPRQRIIGDSVRRKMMYQQGYGKALEPEHPKTLDSKAYPQSI